MPTDPVMKKYAMKIRTTATPPVIIASGAVRAADDAAARATLVQMVSRGLTLLQTERVKRDPPDAEADDFMEVTKEVPLTQEVNVSVETDAGVVVHTINVPAPA
jgi:hypothetical protein